MGEPTINTEQLVLDDSNNKYFYLAFDHFLPIIPNARVQHTRISSDQSAVIDQTFTLNNQTFVSHEMVFADLDLTHTDLTAYYQLLYHCLSLNVRLTLRLLDCYISARV